MDSGRNNKCLHFRTIRCRCPTTKDDSCRRTVVSLINCHFFDKLMTSFNSFNKAPSSNILIIVKRSRHHNTILRNAGTIFRSLLCPLPLSPTTALVALVATRTKDGIRQDADSAGFRFSYRRTAHRTVRSDRQAMPFPHVIAPGRKDGLRR